MIWLVIIISLFCILPAEAGITFPSTSDDDIIHGHIPHSNANVLIGHNSDTPETTGDNYMYIQNYTPGTMWIEEDGLAYATTENKKCLQKDVIFGATPEDSNTYIVHTDNNGFFVDDEPESGNTLLHILLAWVIMAFCSTWYVMRGVML